MKELISYLPTGYNLKLLINYAYMYERVGLVSTNRPTNFIPCKTIMLVRVETRAFLILTKPIP